MILDSYDYKDISAKEECFKLRTEIVRGLSASEEVRRDVSRTFVSTSAIDQYFTIQIEYQLNKLKNYLIMNLS